MSLSISIDLGGSTIDLVLFDEHKKSIEKIISLESSLVNKKNLADVFSKAKIDLKKKSFQNIILTGGHNKKIPHKFQNIPIHKINEIHAIGAGGQFLSGKKKALVISMGTGTCFVSINARSYQHVGGTGLGGGTLMGLSKLLLKEREAQKIEKMANKGNLKTVDLSVKDIVGEAIGIVPGFATASNFGKLVDFKKEDIALGICNLIGQTIGSMARFAAKAHNQKNIILTGKLIKVKKIVEIIKKTAKIYNLDIIVPKNAFYVSAIGAMRYYRKKREI